MTLAGGHESALIRAACRLRLQVFSPGHDNRWPAEVSPWFSL